MYYVLLRSILINNLAGVLTSEKNVPQLPGIFKTLCSPLLESKDLRMVHLCLSVITKTVELWGGEGGINRMVCEDIAPIIFRASLRPDITPKDKIATTLISELATIQRVMYAKCGQQFLQRSVGILPTMGYDPATVQAYAQYLESAQPNQWQDFYKQMLQSRKL